MGRLRSSPKQVQFGMQDGGPARAVVGFGRGIGPRNSVADKLPPTNSDADHRRSGLSKCGATMRTRTMSTRGIATAQPFWGSVAACAQDTGLIANTGNPGDRGLRARRAHIMMAVASGRRSKPESVAAQRERETRFHAAADCPRIGDGYFRATRRGAIDERAIGRPAARSARRTKSVPPEWHELSTQRQAKPDYCSSSVSPAFVRGQAVRATGANLTIIVQGTPNTIRTRSATSAATGIIASARMRTPGRPTGRDRGFCTQPAQRCGGTDACS